MPPPAFQKAGTGTPAGGALWYAPPLLRGRRFLPQFQPDGQNLPGHERDFQDVSIRAEGFQRVFHQAAQLR